MSILGKLMNLNSFLYTCSLLKEFKEANLSSMFKIEKAQREELLKAADGDNTSLRNRNNKVDRDGLLKMSSGI